MTRRAILISVGAVVALGGLAAFLVLQGLDDADKWSSVLSLFFTVAGFLLTVAGLLSGRPAQSADDATAQGSVHQIRGVAGDVVIGRRSPTPAPSPAGTGTSPQPGQAAQSARGVRTGGDLPQVDGVGGSVRIDPESTP
ncbi:hypothetical protein ACIRQF_26835 [Streptomyces sp. NPDC101191]|uniref:hypothetical protein n=1 Tax=Streptomyces sp. NPDC101191 TaxID=3366126 RepID=UPI003820FA20